MRFKTVPMTWLRDRLREELASLGDEGLVITRRGRAIAIVITADRWNRLQDELDDLQAQVMLNGQRSNREAFMAWLEEGDRKVRRPPPWG